MSSTPNPADSQPTPLSAGRLLYLFYHRPRTWLQDRRDAAAGRRGTRAMCTAATALPRTELPAWGLAGPPCRFLTGARFIHQTIFCARSFEWACGTHVRLEIFGDGTLTPAHVAALRHALPQATVADERETQTRLDQALPQERFSVLRNLRERQPLMRKLLDLHAGLAGPSLYLDSDMLFFRPPVGLREWLRAPIGECFMQQAGDALVAPRDQLEALFGHALLPGVNSGILALDDGGFDWPALEAAAACLTESVRVHQWTEQTLFAVHLSRRRAGPLSPVDYVLCNSREDFGPVLPPLRHYVHKAKSLYAANEWRVWLERSRTPATGQP